MTLRLNLGCGRFRLAGYVNVDRDPALGPDVVHDLDVRPYPFPDVSAAEIQASHVLEHLADPFEAVGEWARILAPGGRLYLAVPHFSRGFTHPDHRRGFDVSLPLYFDPSFEGGYTGTPLVCESVRLRWFAQPWLKRRSLGTTSYAVARGLGFWLDLWANLSPYAASRLWGFWVGGFEEIAFVFRKPDEVGPSSLPAGGRSASERS